MSVSLSSGYHPQTNGQTERKVQEIGRYLRSYCHQNQDSWSQFLPWAEYAQNCLRQFTTGLTPFQCILGYQPPLLPWPGDPLEVPAVNHWFQQSKRVWDSAHVHLQQAVRRQKRQADTQRTPTPLYQPGQKVWLSTWDIHLCLTCHESSVHRSIHCAEATQRGHLQAQPSSSISHLTIFPCVSPLTLL